MSKRSIGNLGEQTAAAYLESLGYRILARNYCAQRCEIDIIAFSPNGVTVFVEVKTRSGDKFGLGREAVTAKKQANIYKVAQSYIIEKEKDGAPCRFDVVEYDLSSGKIVHIVDAF